MSVAILFSACKKNPDVNKSNFNFIKAEANYLRHFQGLDSKLTNMQAMAAYWNTQNS